jgi:hypothetical protein
MTSKRLLVFGLQASGKTTFAAALWHLLDSREVPTVLAKGPHSGNYKYLEKIAKSWCEGWKVARTNSDEVEVVRINLRNPVDKSDLVLEFTDLAGESIERAFSSRLCDQTLVDVVNESEGMLLFVSALRQADDVTILDAFGGAREEPEYAAEDDAGDSLASTSGGNNEGKETSWDPDKTPMQIRLVDLLQALIQEPFNQRRSKVAVIISAWDLSDGSTPEVWFSRRYPLLDQYLRGPEGGGELRIYGVSAQGGPVSKRGEEPSADRDRLLSTIPASKRIVIVGPKAREHDLTGPIYWLGGMEPIS